MAICAVRERPPPAFKASIEKLSARMPNARNPASITVEPRKV
jgi:hypothetical protein